MDFTISLKLGNPLFCSRNKLKNYDYCIFPLEGIFQYLFLMLFWRGLGRGRWHPQTMDFVSPFVKK